jgi:trigger factor
MQVTVQRLSPVLIQFDVQVAADRVKTEVDKEYNSVAKNARVRGFRPGKAPRKVLSHVYGERVAAAVAQRLVDETYPQAVNEHKVQPVSTPQIERDEFNEAGPFNYKARVEVLPQIDSVSYEGLPAKRAKNEVSDEQIGKELEQLRTAHSTLEAPSEARGAKNGDAVTIDFKVEVEGDDVSDAGANDFQVDVGSGNLLPQIEQALEGKKVGDSAEAEVPMPANHPHKKLRGKTAKFKITVKDLKERVLPALDDEFAKDVGEFENLQALKDDIKKRIEKQQHDALENAVAEQLVVELVKKNPIDVPPSLVDQQRRITEQEVIQRARSQGGRVTGIADELRAQIQQDAEVKVRAGLLMAEVAKKEGIQVTESDIEDGLKELAEQTGKNVNKVRAEYRDQQRRQMLIGMILENKVLDIIQSKAKIEEG